MTSLNSQESENTKKTPTVLRSAVAMSLGTLSSRILGLVRDQVMVGLFSRTVTDAFIVAFRLPNLFRRLLGEGSLSVSFIPIFIECKSQDGEEEAKKLFFAMQSVLLCVTGVLSVLGVIYMETLMGLLLHGDGFQGVSGKLETTIFLARIMFSYLFLVTNYAFGMAVLNSFKRFFLPALAPAFFNLSIIVFAFVPQSWSSVSGEFLAWGVLFGGIVQVLMVFVPLALRGYWPRFRWPLGKNAHPKVRLVLRNMIPGMIGMGVLQLMALLNVQFASRLQEGSHSYIYLADRILELPQSLIAISLGAALLPTLSEFSSKKQIDKMLEVSQEYLKILLFLALPSAVGMYFLAEPIVRVLFWRGQFSSEDVLMTSSIIQIYSFLLLASSVNKVMIPNFYALKNTWLPALVSSISLVVHFFLAQFLMPIYGIKGLVLSTTFSGILNVLVILICFNIMVGVMNLKMIFAALARFVPGLVAMAAFVFYFQNFLQGKGVLENRWWDTLGLIVTVVVSVVLYFALAFLCKAPEASRFIRRVRKS